jgi:hypothetical protein
MKELKTVTLFREDGKSINVNEGDVSNYTEKGWSTTLPAPKVEAPKPVAPKTVAPKTTK